MESDNTGLETLEVKTATGEDDAQSLLKLILNSGSVSGTF